ncbi:MAG: AEC family transporter [Anaerolineales bacterium]|nr:AEC family transporter [Anaerolineales bacterium]
MIIALLGMLSRKTRIFSSEHIKTISSFVYYFALPSLFFVSLCNTDLLAIDYRVVAGSLLPIAIILFALYLLRLFDILSKDQFILLSLSISFGSYAFFGVAFFETLYGGKWLPLAIVTASILGFTGIIYALVFFEYANKKEKGLSFLLKIIKNPLIISLFLGVLCSLFRVRLGPITNALSLLGKTAGGLAIFSLGIFIYDNFSMKAVRQASMYSIFRSLALPLSTYLVILIFIDVDQDLQRFLFLQSGIPAAISLAVFAERYEYKLAEVTGIVLITSILSFIGLLLLFLISEVAF